MLLHDSGWVLVDEGLPFADAAELIHRRRRQILVHSVLYYKLNENIITDHKFDQWAVELAELQRAYPRASLSVNYMYDAFKDFTGETGAFLPLNNFEAHLVARAILRTHHAHRFHTSRHR